MYSKEYKKCLEARSEKLFLAKCNATNEAQQWEWRKLYAALSN